mmetsp:Transcript_93266/g.114239  ORF Transcript_93266/g.114239 Transcript_93266/m.114239 type:complete len:216 (-) Transcript_93266:623-1270(-)
MDSFDLFLHLNGKLLCLLVDFLKFTTLICGFLGGGVGFHLDVVLDADDLVLHIKESRHSPSATDTCHCLCHVICLDTPGKGSLLVHLVVELQNIGLVRWNFHAVQNLRHEGFLHRGFQFLAVDIARIGPAMFRKEFSQLHGRGLSSQVLGGLLHLLLSLLGGHEGVADDTGDQTNHCEATNHHVQHNQGHHDATGIDGAERCCNVVPARERLDGE